MGKPLGQPGMTEIKSPVNMKWEVTNRFKGLELVNSVPEELWMEVRNTVQETVKKKKNPKEKEKQKGKMVIWGGLTNS